MSTMTYKGYSARIEFDADDEIFFGKIAGIRDGVGFHADTVADLKAAFHEAVDDYIETCAKVGKEPQKPFSGHVMFRIDPETHRRAALAAELSGISLNQWAEEVLEKAARNSITPAATRSASSARPKPAAGRGPASKIANVVSHKGTVRN